MVEPIVTDLVHCCLSDMHPLTVTDGYVDIRLYVTHCRRHSYDFICGCVISLANCLA